MAIKQTIKFTINQDGTVKDEVVGSVATECESLTKTIEDKLMITVAPDGYLKRIN